MSKIGVASRLRVTVVMDNYIDVTLRDEGPVRRWGVASSLASPRQLIAEHGLSLLIEVEGGGVKRRVLMDCGFTKQGVLYNMEVLGIDPSTIDLVFLSHGHLDHYAGLVEILKKAGKRIPIYVHPDAFYTRLFTLPSGLTLGPWRLNPAEVEEAGGSIVAAKTPIPLAPGLSTTGEVERAVDFEKGLEVARRIRDGIYEPDPILDDQALTAYVEGLGLIVITGCAHAGVVNTVRHSMKLAGVDEVYAVVGGFHLSGVEEGVVDETIRWLRRLGAKLVMPMHCTGFKAAAKMASELREGFIVSSVGATVSLGGM